MPTRPIMPPQFNAVNPKFPDLVYLSFQYGENQRDLFEPSALEKFEIWPNIINCTDFRKGRKECYT